MKTVLITGASSGIGKETAKLFLQNDYAVIPTARSLSKLEELRQLGAYTVQLDVTDTTSINTAFTSIFEQFGSVQVLINNAGYSQNGFIEELPLSRLRYQFEVNVFGLVRVAQMVLPGMRRQRSGHIINVGSMGGDFTSPGAGAYHASKYALESITDAMRQELLSFGIKVSLIKPGGVETAFIDNSDFPAPIEGNPYGTMRTRFQEMLKNILKSNSSSFPILKPERVAKEIFATATAVNPPTRIRIGRSAKLIPVMKSLLSDKAFDKMIINQLGLTK
jgi:short-subunit dehydrogenase